MTPRATQVRPATRRDADRSRRHTVVSVGLVSVAVVAVLAALLGVRSVLAEDPAPGSSLSVPHGSLVVNAVTPEIMQHPKGMPASMMPDPVPDGFQRFSVDVTVFAEEDAAARYDAGELRVSAPGVEESAPLRGTLGSGSIPRGGQVTGTVLFQVPEDVRTVDLGVQGESEVVRVRVPANQGHHGG